MTSKDGYIGAVKDKAEAIKGVSPLSSDDFTHIISGESGKVKKRKGKKVGDLKGVSGLTGPTSDRQRKKPDDTRS
ncbi:hypothetical protein ALC56_06837 [Trachymyrmex septentrionalis]|uniref:Uncharacterized protein n=1 Tax=Trachymyrmex septentrionalis TaxID=34720 RepID=A0A195FEK9_9HYME|nr:hypothetical protein ALC56_06837 [Trachymyrmex septentrionalis]